MGHPVEEEEEDRRPVGRMQKLVDAQLAVSDFSFDEQLAEESSFWVLEGVLGHEVLEAAAPQDRRRLSRQA